MTQTHSWTQGRTGQLQPAEAGTHRGQRLGPCPRGLAKVAPYQPAVSAPAGPWPSSEHRETSMAGTTGRLLWF